jgi:hypothetical protein
MFHTQPVRQAWNRLVSHLSDGLMYGHEVPRPGWFVTPRKVNWHPILNRAPSRRRALILEDILAGLSYRQIMRKQGIAKSTVSMQAAKLYKQHRVKGPAALRALLRRSSEVTRRETNEQQHSSANAQTKAAA